MLADGKEPVDQPLLDDNQPGRCVRVACHSAHLAEPRVEIVDAGQVLRGSIRHVESTQRHSEIRLPVALDIRVSLECPDTTSGTEALDGPSEIERLSRSLGANLGAAF